MEGAVSSSGRGQGTSGRGGEDALLWRREPAPDALDGDEGDDGPEEGRAGATERDGVRLAEARLRLGLCNLLLPDLADLLALLEGAPRPRRPATTSLTRSMSVLRRQRGSSFTSSEGSLPADSFTLYLTKMCLLCHLGKTVVHVVLVGLFSELGV